MKIVIEVDPGELTEEMARDMIRQLGKEIGLYGAGTTTLHSPWASFSITSLEVQ